MEVIKLCQIVRDPKPVKTPGEFLINGKFFGYTLEDIVRPKGIYKPKETAIDYGRFGLIMTYSNRFKKIMPLIVNVEKANPPILYHGVNVSDCGLRIHGGNTVEDTEGCPELGKSKNPFGDCSKINDDFRTWLTASIQVNKVFLEIGKLDSNGKFFIPTTW